MKLTKDLGNFSAVVIRVIRTAKFEDCESSGTKLYPPSQSVGAVYSHCPRHPASALATFSEKTKSTHVIRIFFFLSPLFLYNGSKL